MPSLWARTMPALTPGGAPKSSALTISRRSLTPLQLAAQVQRLLEPFHGRARRAAPGRDQPSHCTAWCRRHRSRPSGASPLPKAVVGVVSRRRSSSGEPLDEGGEVAEALPSRPSPSRRAGFPAADGTVDDHVGGVAAVHERPRARRARRRCRRRHPERSPAPRPPRRLFYAAPGSPARPRTDTSRDRAASRYGFAARYCPRAPQSRRETRRAIERPPPRPRSPNCHSSRPGARSITSQRPRSASPTPATNPGPIRLG